MGRKTMQFESGKFYRKMTKYELIILKITNADNPDYIIGNILRETWLRKEIQIDDVITWEAKGFIETTEEQYHELKQKIITNI